MMSKNKKESREQSFLSERNVFLALIVIGILIRIPLYNFFNMVTYDGTYYIHDAKSILGESFPTSPFPFGYPLLIALVIPIFKNGVIAARMVSIIAGVGLPVVIYKIAREYIGKKESLFAALLVLITPLCLRMSMITMSESIYVFWLFFGLLLFARRKDLPCGVLMGLAAITRPEALGVFGVLALLRLRRMKQLMLILAGFSFVYSINIVVKYSVTGEFVLLSKTGFFGTHAENWEERENWIDSGEKEQFKDIKVANEGEKSLIADYVKTVPGEFILLIKHVSIILFLLALYGIYRKRIFLLASFVPFLIYPLFTVRREARHVLPYIPSLIIYAMIGLSSLSKHKTRVVIYSLVSLSVISGLVINRAQLTEPVAKKFQWAKVLGPQLSENVKPGDKVADRKPYLAFYSGAVYFEIPAASYNKTMNYLLNENVKYLVCHKSLIDIFRPALKGFIYDEVLVNGEFRYNQIYFMPNLAVYQKNRYYKPLIRKQILKPQGRKVFGLTWSPDGKSIAYRDSDVYGNRGIYIIKPEEDYGVLAVKLESIQGSFSWSPDSKSIACSLKKDGNNDIYICHLSGGVDRVTSHEAFDIDPFWSNGGTEIAFISERSNSRDVWVKNLESGELTRITRGGVNEYPAISPDSKSLAWIRRGEGLILYARSSGIEKLVPMGRNVHFTPVWSRDGRYLMMTRRSWGTTNVCVMSSDGENILQLTGSDLDECSPTWSPDGKSVAVFTMHDGKVGIRIISGMDQYFNRIAFPQKGRPLIPNVFTRQP